MNEEQFEKIASEAITQAEQIDCSLDDFCDGLKAMIDVLRERHEQVENELGR